MMPARAPHNLFTRTLPYFMGGSFILDDADEAFVMPAQFWSAQPHWRPTQRLCAALLWDALETWRTCAGRSSMLARRKCAEVEAWFDGASAPFSLADVCAALNYDVAGVQRMWREYISRGVHGHGFSQGPLPTPCVNKRPLAHRIKNCSETA